MREARQPKKSVYHALADFEAAKVGRLLGAACELVLLIACGNVANLLLARSGRRSI